MENLFWRCTTVVGILLLFSTTLVASDESSSNKINDTDISLFKTKRQASAIPAIETCRKLREECLRSCPTIKNCTEQCPICPTLTKVDPVVETKENDIINRNFIVQNGNGTEDRFSVQHLAGANYTTIIRLSNIINNTNIVKVPTVVNATNINNIKIFANSSAENDGPFGLGLNNKSEPCCYAIHPKTCRYSLDGGYRCQHRRHKMCSNQCKSRQMHIQARNRCTSDRGCQRKVAYVPEPRVTCSYVNYWPYINCGGIKSRYSCAGCYDHYGYGFSAYYLRNDDMDCSGCYNDAFDYGPLYRRGPVLRPFYYHEPPCYVTGRCSYSGYYQSEFGSHFGHELIDPVFGPVYDDDTLENDNNNTISDWGVVLSKCKVVSDNETVSLENCTLSKDNPFAAAPEIIRSFVPTELMDYEEMYSQYESPKVNFNKRNRNSNSKLTRRMKRKIKKNPKKRE